MRQYVSVCLVFVVGDIVYGVAVDPEGRLYFATYYGYRVEMTDLEGKGRSTFTRTNIKPLGILLDLINK